MKKINNKNCLEGKTVQIGYSDIDLKVQAPEFKKANMTDCYGQYTQRENIIDIQPGLSDIDEANTLIHEILHAAVWISSLSQSGQPLQQTNDEEVVVNSLSNKLTQILIDNEWLLPYLTEKLKNK